MSNERERGTSSTFHNAAEMSSLADEMPSLEGVGAHTDPRLVVEKLRVGRTEVTAVLAEHSSENAAAIAESMKGCKVLALESVGHIDEADRAEWERVYTALLSSHTDSAVVDRTFAILNGKDNGMVEALPHLRGSDARVVLLDIARSHPEYGAVEAAVAAEREYAAAIVALIPLAQARATLSHSVASKAAESEVRDRVLAEQIKNLVQDVGADTPVGICVGSTHYRALEDAHRDGEEETALVVAARVKEIQSLYDRAAEAIRAQDSAAAQAMMDRVLLSGYLSVHGSKSGEKLQTDEFVKSLDEATVTGILDVLDGKLSDASVDAYTRSRTVAVYLSAILDIT